MESNLQLFVNGTNDTIGQINLAGDEPISLSISIQDIKDISKRNSTFSQNFIIPADKNNNILLNHIFNIGADSTFDPRKKTPCFMLNDTMPVFTGNFQLVKINVKNRNVISYECVVYGEVIDLVKELGDKLLTDLDYTELNHFYTVDDIEASWYADTKTLGYYYPLIDYGFDLNLSQLNSGVLSIVLDSGTATLNLSTINTLTDSTKLWPTGAFNGKTIYITQGTGVGQSRTILSNNLTTITTTTNWTTIPDSSTVYNITQLDYSNPYSSFGNGMSPLLFRPAISNSFLFTKILATAGFSLSNGIIDSDVVAETIIPFNGNIEDVLPKSYMDTYAFRTSLTVDQVSPSANYTSIIQFDDDSTPPNYDPGNLFNTATKRYTADRVGAMSFVVQARIFFTGSTLPAVKRVAIDFYRSSLANPTAVSFSTKFFDISSPIFNFDYNLIFESDALDNPNNPLLRPMIPGDEVFAVISFVNGGVNQNHLKANDTFMYNVPKPKLVPGVKIFYNKFIPANIKQIDYIKSIISMFNLMTIPDKDNPKKINFVPRSQYYGAGVIKDWTNKVDHTEKIEEIVISEQQSRTIKLTYKPDKDYYNTYYTDNTNTVFGEYKKEIDNEWVQGEQKIEVIFSPTPVDKVLGSDDIYIPKLVKRDAKTGIYSRTDFNIRFLRKNKNLMPTINTIQLEGKAPINLYPYSGHLDHPTIPQMDYNFGAIQWSFYPELNSLTENNLVYLYWLKYLNEIADKNAKMIKCKILLSANDIAQFNYNDNIYIEGLTDDGGHYFYVNKITYAPTSNLPSTVELIKIIARDQVVLGRIPLLNPIKRYVGKALELGRENNIGSVALVEGDNNIIGTNADGAVIIGSNNRIADNAKNVVLINTNGKYIKESFVTIVGNTYFNPDGTFTTIYNDIDSGLDTVLNPFATNMFNDIESGKDAVLNIGSMSPIKDIDSGLYDQEVI